MIAADSTRCGLLIGRQRNRSSDWLGPRASRPQRAEGAKALHVAISQSVFALRARCGGTPAVPANHLSGFKSIHTFHSLSGNITTVVQFVF